MSNNRVCPTQGARSSSSISRTTAFWTSSTSPRRPSTQSLVGNHTNIQFITIVTLVINTIDYGRQIKLSNDHKFC
jgi:hypothetical protein